MSLAICDTCLGTGEDEGAPCMDCAETGHGWDWDDEEDEMPEPLVIVVPWDVALTSPNTRGHFMRKARVNAAARERARLAWLEAGQPEAAGPVSVSVVVRRGRKMDDDNLAGGIKPLRDGLFNRAVTPDDSPGWVQMEMPTQETGKEFRDRPEVEFRISERGEP